MSLLLAIGEPFYRVPNHDRPCFVAASIVTAFSSKMFGS